jgi:hypothetical protein
MLIAIVTFLGIVGYLVVDKIAETVKYISDNRAEADITSAELSLTEE